MATITVRKLDANGDPLQGNGQASFLSDIDAVAQIIATRLKFLQGEWWEALNDGTPLFQTILGGGGSPKQIDADALILTQRILGSAYVTSIAKVTTRFTASTRSYQFQCEAQTPFGPITITSQAPGLSASLGY
jgi:hypothetical protein